jgi:hypothetical protein
VPGPVGIEHNGAKLPQLLGYKAFSRRDAAKQAKNTHGCPQYESLRTVNHARPLL